MTTDTLTRQAREIARDMHDHNFSSRRGFGDWEEDGETIGFYIYDNNPWAADPTLRDRHYAELADAMARRECRLVAQASYPDAGAEDAGYTVALIFESAEPSRASEDKDAAIDLIEAMIARDVPIRSVPAKA